MLGGEGGHRHKVESIAPVRVQKGVGIEKGVVKIVCRSCGRIRVAW